MNGQTSRAGTPETREDGGVDGAAFQVFLRLRPESAELSDSRFISTTRDGESVYVTAPSDKRSSGRGSSTSTEKFGFTNVFEEDAEQMDVFEDAVLPLLQDCVQKGQDAMLATLGVTGSGKTHTILGDRYQQGMLQMALSVLFTNLEDVLITDPSFPFADHDTTDSIHLSFPAFDSRIHSVLETSSRLRTPSEPDTTCIPLSSPPKSRYAVCISMYELHNDRIFDVLDETPLHSPARRRALSFKKIPPPFVSSEPSTRKAVAGLRKIHATSLEEALMILQHGQALRHVASSTTSSRSHVFFQIELKRFSPRGNPKDSAFFTIADLAGSERTKDAGSVNRSLMFIGQCLTLLLKSSSSRSSYASAASASICRQNKLTDLLFNNSFSTPSQRFALITTADPYGDYTSTAQILRATALSKSSPPPPPAPECERKHSIDSASSVSLSRSSSLASENAASSLLSNRTVESTTTVESLPLRDSNASDSPLLSTSKDIINRLLHQLHTLEASLEAAEQRNLEVEQQVREEVAEEWEQRMEEMMEVQKSQNIEEEFARQEYVDDKISILQREIEEDTQRIRSLQGQNGELRRENAEYKQENQELRDEMRELRDDNERLQKELRELKRKLRGQERAAVTQPPPASKRSVVEVRETKTATRTTRADSIRSVKSTTTAPKSAIQVEVRELTPSPPPTPAQAPKTPKTPSYLRPTCSRPATRAENRELRTGSLRERGERERSAVTGSLRGKPSTENWGGSVRVKGAAANLSGSLRIPGKKAGASRPRLGEVLGEELGRG